MARAKIESKSKSARVREYLAAGKSVSEAAAAVGIGYAFAYGIASRMTDPETGQSMNTVRANRRSVRAVAVVGEIAEIRPKSGGVIRIDLNTGAVKRTAK